MDLIGLLKTFLMALVVVGIITFFCCDVYDHTKEKIIKKIKKGRQIGKKDNCPTEEHKVD